MDVRPLPSSSADPFPLTVTIDLNESFPVEESRSDHRFGGSVVECSTDRRLLWVILLPTHSPLDLPPPVG